jgi:hypothetical protein
MSSPACVAVVVAQKWVNLHPIVACIGDAIMELKAFAELAKRTGKKGQQSKVYGQETTALPDIAAACLHDLGFNPRDDVEFTDFKVASALSQRLCRRACRGSSHCHGYAHGVACSMQRILAWLQVSLTPMQAWQYFGAAVTDLSSRRFRLRNMVVLLDALSSVRQQAYFTPQDFYFLVDPNRRNLTGNAHIHGRISVYNLYCLLAIAGMRATQKEAGVAFELADTESVCTIRYETCFAVACCSASLRTDAARVLSQLRAVLRDRVAAARVSHAGGPPRWTAVDSAAGADSGGVSWRELATSEGVSRGMWLSTLLPLVCPSSDSARRTCDHPQAFAAATKRRLEKEKARSEKRTEETREFERDKIKQKRELAELTRGEHLARAEEEKASAKYAITVSRLTVSCARSVHACLGPVSVMQRVSRCNRGDCRARRRTRRCIARRCTTTPFDGPPRSVTATRSRSRTQGARQR